MPLGHRPDCPCDDCAIVPRLRRARGNEAQIPDHVCRDCGHEAGIVVGTAKTRGDCGRCGTSTTGIETRRIPLEALINTIDLHADRIEVLSKTKGGRDRKMVLTELSAREAITWACHFLRHGEEPPFRKPPRHPDDERQ